MTSTRSPGMRNPRLLPTSTKSSNPRFSMPSSSTSSLSISNWESSIRVLVFSTDPGSAPSLVVIGTKRLACSASQALSRSLIGTRSPFRRDKVSDEWASWPFCVSVSARTWKQGKRRRLQENESSTYYIAGAEQLCISTYYNLL